MLRRVSNGATYLFPKDTMELKTDKDLPGASTIYVFDIPKSRLTVDII
ncbi:MAG: hypothetical protein HPY66_1686 [Firmicutes bacterium]|nr:hypothetical protein [Bacillota bacterium]